MPCTQALCSNEAFFVNSFHSSLHTEMALEAEGMRLGCTKGVREGALPAWHRCRWQRMAGEGCSKRSSNERREVRRGNNNLQGSGMRWWQ